MADGDIVPQLQDFATVGHLYRSIEQGLAHLAEKFGERNLFVGPPRAQATSTDFRWPELVAVTDLASPRRALDTILEQGEGARGHWETAHFGQFVEILEEYRSMLSANAAFDPVRPVMFATVRRGERDSIPLIGDRVTSLCTDVFNVSYEILVQILERYFAHGRDRSAARDAGERRRHAAGRRPPAARRPDHDAAGRTGASGTQRRAELRALLRGRRTPTPPGFRLGPARGARA